jgi:hypothetical protein
MVRQSCAAIRLICEQLESSVAVHLELLDAVLVARHGDRWWERLVDPEGEE